MAEVDSIFHEARRLTSEARERYLDAACGGDASLRANVEELLAADDAAGSFMALAQQEEQATRMSVAYTESAGQIIDRYKLLQQIGEGGFGTVWMAEQKKPIKRRVALKIIKLGMDTKQVIARFEAERQALAMMDHINIAKVLDAGATDTGRPYFVMELVKGIPILEYCDEERLDTQARLNLFKQVCNAIQHAHQKGIIHRDIKPSNVLVTLHDGTPVVKVIDFGIAKATNTELTQKTLFTEHRQMIGTPAYMSPEQAEMSGLDIDTRSDVYSLGVLLYELLTGTTPFDSKELMSKGFAEMMRIIREVEPHKPSTRLSTLGETGTRTAELRRADVKRLGSILRGDLDWIVMKCLEKDRGRRYETANGVAADIERHLTGEPVVAAPPSRMYRMRKFARRNKAQVVVGSIITTMLVLGILGVSIFAVRAEQQRVRAEEARAEALAARDAEAEQRRLAEESEQRAITAAERAIAAEADAEQRSEELAKVAAFQASQLADIETELMGNNIRRNIIEKHRTALETFNLDEEEVTRLLGELDLALARVNFTNVALEALDENIFERALIAIAEQFEDEPEIRARLLQTVAVTLRALGLLDRATKPLTEALDIRRQVFGDEHRRTLGTISHMGLLLQQQGKYAEAEPFLREAMEGRRRVLGVEHSHTLNSVNNMGNLLWQKGRYAEAKSYHREALKGYRRVFGDEHPNTLSSIANTGVLLRSQGKLEQAEPYYREALEGRRRVLGDEHPETLRSIANMGNLLKHQSRYADAEPYHREALKGYRRVFGDEHPETLRSIASMGGLLQLQGKLEEAESYGREALEARRRVLGDEHPDTLASITNLGGLLWEHGRYAETEPVFREAMEISRRVLGDEHPRTLRAIGNMGFSLVAQGKLAEAEPYLHEVLEGNRRILGDKHPDTLISVNAMGGLLWRQGKYAEAELFSREALKGFRQVLGDEHPDTLFSVVNMGALLQAQGKLEEAEPYFREALEGRGRVLGNEHPDTLGSINNLAELLRDLEAFTESEELALEYEERRRARHGDDHEQTHSAVEHLADLYDAWHEAEPGNGYDGKAAEWRAKLPLADETVDDGQSDDG